MLVTPSSSPPATPSSPPRTAPGQALTHAGHEDDDHWHDCQEPFCPRTLNFNGLDQSAQFPRLTSEDLDSARRVSQTEPAITPPCSLPVTPNGSRAASPVGAGPSRLVRRWSRISGYRTPGTADGFVRCWQTRTDATSEASSSRMSRPSLAPPVDQTVQRDQALSETRGMLEQCILELIARAGNLEAQQQDVWRRLQSSLTRTERLLKHVEPDDLLGPLEQKAVVLTFVMEVHIQKKKYRRQTAAALKTLLQSEAWRQAFLQDLELRALSQKPEAQELRGLLPPIPPPTLTRLPIAAKEEEAPYPLPIFSQPLSARPVGPTLVTSPTRRAAVDADVKVVRERRARRATRRPGEPLGETLRCCRDQVEALEFAAAGETDEVQVAFETFHRAVRQAFGKAAGTDFSKDPSQQPPDQTTELATYEPKAEMVVFLKDVWAKRKVLRARVSFVLHRLESLDAWKAILDSMPEVQELINPESPGHPSPTSPGSPSNFSEPEPEVSSTSRAAEVMEEKAGGYTAFPEEEEDAHEELHDCVRREAPWYLRMCIWLIGVNRTLRFCKCLVPSRIHREVSGSVLLTKSEKLHVNEILMASGSSARL